MTERQIAHALQFAAAFALVQGAGLHEQENVIKRQIDSFIVVESKFDQQFNPFAFVQVICADVATRDRQLAREISVDCSPANRG